MKRIFFLCRINGIIRIFYRDRMIELPAGEFSIPETIKKLGSRT